MIWSIDEFSWDVPCKVEREAEMTASDLSGMLLDRTYFNDVLGTYMKYTVGIAIPKGMENDYHDLYDILTDPKGYHTCILPYNSAYIEVTGKIDSVSDVYVRLPQNKRIWRKIEFDVISCTPTKKYSQDELIKMGTMPLPDEEEFEEGAAFMFSESEWTELADADDSYY